MHSEAELRQLLGESATPAPLDTKDVIRRTRARRLPRQLAAGAVTSLAILGIGVATLTGLTNLRQGTDTAITLEAPESDNQAGSDGAASDESIALAPATKLHACGAPLAEVATSSSGLVLTVEFPETAAVGADLIAGIAVLTNTGASRITGTTAVSPSITVSSAGVVVWHTNGPIDSSGVVVDLGPGESIRYEAWFEPVRCDSEDESTESFRAGLPVLAAGTYDLSAAIDLFPESPTGTVEVVTGPASSIRLE